VWPVACGECHSVDRFTGLRHAKASDNDIDVVHPAFDPSGLGPWADEASRSASRNNSVSYSQVVPRRPFIPNPIYIYLCANICKCR